MFESAVIRPQASGLAIVDAGLLAETLIFYDKVHLVADRGLLLGLFRVISPANFLSLVRSGRMSVSFSKYMHGVSDTQFDFGKEYSFISFALAKQASGKRIARHDEVREAVSSVMGFNRASRKVCEGLIESFKFIDRSFPAGHSVAIAHSELDDVDLLHLEIETLLSKLVPSYKLPRNWIFRVVYINSAFTISTDLDFNSINVEYHKVIPPSHSTITPSYLLSFILTAYLEANMAADYMSEIVTGEESASLIRLKVSSLIRKRDKNAEQIDVFQENVLSDCKKVREAINSGERTFTEFLTVLEKSARFKEWLSSQNPDTQLIEAYLKAVMSDGPMSSLRGKTMRYITTSLVGLLGPVAGLLASGADEFLVDKLTKGWRPNHFIDGPLRKFTAVD